jgi:hypothetical protein
VNAATVSWLEMVSAFINVVGVLATSEMMWRTRRRMQSVRRMLDYQPGGPRIMIGWRHQRCEIGRIAYHLFFLAAGVWAMWLADSTSTYGLAIMTGRIVLSCMFTTFSVLDLIGDSRLDGLLGPGQNRS